MLNRERTHKESDVQGHTNEGETKETGPQNLSETFAILLNKYSNKYVVM